MFARFLRRAEFTAYRLLNEDGRQSELNNIAEYIISAVICLDVLLIVLESMGLGGTIGAVLGVLRLCFFIFFLIEYILRVWIADIVLRDRKHPVKSRLRYMLTFRAIINLLAILPAVFKVSFIDVRIFQILRLLWVTQLIGLRQYTDLLAKVIKLKGGQLLSALFLMLIFLLVCSLVIYDLESKAQPEVFENILSGLWWSMSAITTIGYGDMYPITHVGRILGSLMSVFGIFLMAIPTAILTYGFMEVSGSNKKD